MQASVIQEQEFIRRSRDEIEKRTGKTPEQLYEEREKRIIDTINLKEPDRVPVLMRLGYFPLRYAGLTQSVAFYQPQVHKQAVMKTLLDFEPDAYLSAGNMTYSGLSLGTLDAKQVRWPGGNLPADVTFQYIDMAVMKENEYDLFMTDPTDFVLRHYLPRKYGALEPLSKLPTMGQNLIGSASPLVGLAPTLIKPDIQRMAQTLLQASREQAEFHDFDEDIGQLGFPLGTAPSGFIGNVEPFDIFASYLRGLPGVISDMFRQPEKLLAACERVLEWRLARAAPATPDKYGFPRRVQVGSFHFCSDRFLGKKQFETFVWPTWKKQLLAAINLGYIASPFGEGKCDDRVEYFLEMPKRKVWIRFTEVDMARAKDILRDHVCIGGNVPAALLQIGSPQEVEEYCQNLIKVCGKGGGFILGCGSSMDEGKPANIKAMIESAKKYGRY